MWLNSVNSTENKNNKPKNKVGVVHSKMRKQNAHTKTKNKLEQAWATWNKVERARTSCNQLEWDETN